MTSFTLSVLEKWESKSGEPRSHRSDIDIEVVGKQHEEVYENVRPGDWVQIDGYFRSEQFNGSTVITVRVFNIIYQEHHDKDESRRDESTMGGPQAKT